MRNFFLLAAFVQISCSAALAQGTQLPKAWNTIMRDQNNWKMQQVAGTVLGNFMDKYPNYSAWRKAHSEEKQLAAIALPGYAYRNGMNHGPMMIQPVQSEMAVQAQYRKPANPPKSKMGLSHLADSLAANLGLHPF
jgi:hypothetical protein